MTCDEVRELLPAYALDLLEGGELEAVEAHLHAGREHDEELVELRATSFALDRLGEEEAIYSPELRERVREIAVTAEARERGAPSPPLPRKRGRGQNSEAGARATSSKRSSARANRMTSPTT